MRRPFRVIIAGSRNFTNYGLLESFADKCLKNKVADGTPIEIISGRAKGADQLGEKYANERGYSLVCFPAKWGEYGKMAGFVRNREMGEYADALIAFWDGKSKGTQHMIDFAKKKNLAVRVCKFEDLRNRMGK